MAKQWAEFEDALSRDARIGEGLSPEEDDELRRLHWLSQIGSLAMQRAERLIELRLRDRRKEVRPPREFERLARSQVQEGFLTLHEVRWQLEYMHKARLLKPFSPEDQLRYDELLRIEHELMQREGSRAGSQVPSPTD